jgi:two-component system cell cycle response regulator
MGLRILVIEDNPANLELMTYLLRAFGHATLSAVDGEAGVEAALAGAPDLILCDLALPGLDGYGVARRLKAEPALAGVPLIAVTASAMVGDRDRVIAAGFDGYMSKPITPETFVSEVEAFFPASAAHGNDPGG